jgi:hypothetical protein
VGIKDRIAAANDGGSDDQDDELEGDDLLESFAAGSEDVADEAEPMPSWMKDEEEGDEEVDPLPDSGPPLEDEDEEAEEDAVEPDVSDSDTDVEEEVVEPEVETPALDALRDVGFETDGLTESQAAKKLGKEFKSFASHWNQLVATSRQASEMIPHAEDFKKYLEDKKSGSLKKPDDSSPATPETKSTIKDALSSVETLLAGQKPEPENNPTWQSYISSRQIIWDGMNYVPAPSAQHLSGIAEKLNTHESWKNDQLKLAMRTPEALRTIAKALADGGVSSKDATGLTMEQVQAHLKVQAEEEADSQFTQRTLSNNAKWMFVHNRDGRIATHPITGLKILTPEGVAYTQELVQLQKKGITDSKDQHFYALVTVAEQLRRKGFNTDGEKEKTPPPAAGPGAIRPATLAGPAGNAAKTPEDKRVALLRQKKNQAANQPNKRHSGNSGEEEKIGSGKPVSFGNMLKEAFKREGIGGK